MPTSEPPPLQLTIQRQDDTHIVVLNEGGALIARSDTPVAASLLRDLVTELTSVATFHGMGEDRGRPVPSDKPDVIVQRFEQIGTLIFSQLLPEKVRQRLTTAPSSDFYLCLDEQLIQIPWELCYDGSEFLATKFCMGRQVITHAPVPERRFPRAETGPLKVLLIADPTEDLPQAADEGEQLCRLLDQVPGVRVKLLAGRFASKTHILLELQAHDIVHFAGHSHYDPEHPQKSGWHLHGEVLTAEELSALKNPPRLVFSNSCQAGATPAWGGRYQYDGQAFGIGSAFLLAGVTNYIGTFWVVHDQESRIFAVAFYQGIAEGRSVGEALQHARLRVRQEIKQQKGWEGLTWASYMLYGDPTVTLLPPLLPAPEGERELAALLSADVEGYSRHMGLDDIATMQTLNLYRQVMATLIATQRGTVVDMTGDNVLASFPSVARAVRCAVEIQRELKARNAELPVQRQLRFRIGVNFGDVIRQERGLYGDALNSAARLEKLAPPGGICISSSVYEQVKNRLQPLNVGYQYLGKQKLHNIPQPVAAYHVLIEPAALSFRLSRIVWILRVSVSSQRNFVLLVSVGTLIAALTWIWLHQSRAIVVMDFPALKTDPNLVWMSEAIRDYLNSQLSNAPNLEVYSNRHFDFEVRKRNGDPIAVAQALGVGKTITGNFLVFGNRLRITAHINNVQNGREEASALVEGELDNFFELVKDLAEKIRNHLNVVVTLEQPSSTPSPSAPSLETYKLLLEGEGETSAVKPPKTEQPSSHNLPDKDSEKHSWISPPESWFAPSTARADETSSQGTTPEEEVRQVLEKYRQAYEKKDPDLLETVYATFTPAQREANTKYFQNAQDLRITIRDINITIRGDEAAVSYTREDEFTDTNTGQKVKLDVRFTKILVRVDGIWKIIVGKK